MTIARFIKKKTDPYEPCLPTLTTIKNHAFKINQRKIYDEFLGVNQICKNRFRLLESKMLSNLINEVNIINVK